MRDDVDDLDRPNTGGMGPGTIAAAIAVLVIVGAIFMWGPWSSNTSNTSNTAANPAPATTVGQSSAPPSTSNSPMTPPHSVAPPSESDSPTTSAPTTR
jgi:hypothetical protein